MDRSHPTRMPNSRNAPPNVSPLAARLLARAVAGPNDCLIWTGFVDGDGYGKYTVQNRGRYVHRIVHEELVGPIPAGMQLDHTCHTRDANCPGGNGCAHRRCINPLHLEAVSARENSIRANGSFVSVNFQKTQCDSGHAFTPDNTYVRTNGTRRCRACQNEWTRAYRARRRDAVVAK